MRLPIPTGSGRTSGGDMGSRLLIGIVMGIFALISFFASSEYNPITGKTQHLSLTAQQEIALGLQAAPEMIQEFGGLLNDQRAQTFIDELGTKLVNNSIARGTPWRFEFHVLADPQTVNAFALPGGQVFITRALMAKLTTEDQVAGVISHEIVHVLARHGAQRMAKSELTNGLIGAVGVASGSADVAQTAAVIGQMINMKYGREDEIESDTLGVCLMISAGYDPTAMVEVMKVLEAVGGGSRQPEFMSTHPSPENRIERIQQAIQDAPSRCPASSSGR